MSNIGYLLWWKVAGEVDLDHDRLERLLQGTQVDLPARPVPHDVYRRITGPDMSMNAVVPDGTLELTLATVDASNKKVLARHMVGTLKDEKGVTRVVRKVGDVAFHYPPRGQNQKARMRVVASSPFEEWTEAVEHFAGLLRREYARGVKGALDNQAVRRLVRAYLAKIHALYVDGPYFVWDAEPVEHDLGPLFAALGGECFLHVVPMPDDETQRRFLRRCIQKVIDADNELDDALRDFLDPAS